MPVPPVAPSGLLLMAIAVLVAAALALTAFGARRAPYRGGCAWVSALWLTAGGAVAATLLPGAWAGVLAAPLLLAWPVLALVGMRQFHPRQTLPGGAALDAVVWLAVGALTLAAALTGPAPGESVGLALACGTLVLHLYAAWLLFLVGVDRDATPVHGLAATIALTAFAPGLALVPGTGSLQALAAHAAAAALGAVVLAFVAITLVCERTERQLRDSRRRLRVLANLDTLTQMPNRRHFAELADRALRDDRPGSAVLVLFDVDHFKQINDRLGHAAGDRALCLVCGCVLEHLRAQDVPGRQGGDEFVLLLREASTAQGMGVAARIVTEVQRRAPGHDLPALTLSFGLVQMGLAEPVAAALRRADQALYEAKRQGRSRAVAAQGDERQPVFSESQRLGLTGA